jgi:hypothetical protein
MHGFQMPEIAGATNPTFALVYEESRRPVPADLLRDDAYHEENDGW